MKNSTSTLVRFAALLAISLLAPAFAFADIIYYNFETGNTSAFYLDGDMVIRQECPPLKLLNSRADCANGSIQKVLKFSDANQVMVSNLSHVASVGDLEPLKSPAVKVLLAGPPFSQSALLMSRQAAQADKDNYVQIIAKFGADSGIQSKLDSANANLNSIDQHLAANTNYDLALNDFTPLNKTYFEMIADPTKKVELVAAKLKGTLAGAISDILTRVVWSTTPISGSLATLRAGAKGYDGADASLYAGKTLTVLSLSSSYISLTVSGSGASMWFNASDVISIGSSIWQ